MTDVTSIAATRRKTGHLQAQLALWHRNHVTRRALRRLGPDRMADIGRTTAEVRREARKWFWQT